MNDAPCRIDLSTNIGEFFRELVAGAARRRRVEASPEAEVYLSTLLADLAQPGAPCAEVLDRPFALQLADAATASGAVRFERLRILGDGVLYTSAFFAERLVQRGVELDYARSVGAAAYDQAAGMLRAGRGEGAGPAGVLDELARRFRAFAELFEEIADRLRARSASTDSSVLSLYERWLRTGSTSLAEALGERGLAPLRRVGGAC